MFTGRKAILGHIAQCFNPSATSEKQRIFVLYGLGGSGKTQLMLKFVEEFGDQCGPFLSAAIPLHTESCL